MRKEDKSFKSAIDETLNKIKEDGTGERISVKWFGGNILK